MADQDRVHQIHELTLEGWKWYKDKAQTIPAKRDDYFWQIVTDDIKNMTKKDKIENANCRNFLKGMLIVYMNELQGEYCEWLSTKQERLPI